MRKAQWRRHGGMEWEVGELDTPFLISEPVVEVIEN
jgi:hypothetical protein